MQFRQNGKSAGLDRNHAFKDDRQASGLTRARWQFTVNRGVSADMLPEWHSFGAHSTSSGPGLGPVARSDANKIRGNIALPGRDPGRRLDT